MKPSSTLKGLFLGVLLVGSAYVCLRTYTPKEPPESPQESGVPEPAANQNAAITPPAHTPDPGLTAVVPPASIVTGSPQAAPAENAPAVQDAWKISENALRQISALQEAKLKRTASQTKLASPLIDADKTLRGEPLGEGIASLPSQLELDANGRVLVDMDAKVNDALLRQIETAGGKVVNHFARYDAIRAWLPVAQAETLAAREDVRFIRPADKAETHVGSVNSQGDVTHRATTARTSFGVNGSGVKVGVLSDSTDHLATSQASGDLGTVTVLAGQSGIPGSGEGTAMLEIVHDVAPGAELFYATGFGGVAAFAQNIRNLRFQSRCDIIIDDVGYFNESPFQDGVIAQAVNDVTADGALFFSSAANSGNKSDNRSGTWEGDFVDGGAFSIGSQALGRLHSFGPSTANTVLAGGSSRHVDFFWADPLGAATNDYDVYVLDAAGANVVAKSDSSQNGSQDPYEFVNKLDVGQRIILVRFQGAGRYLHLGTGRGLLAISTSGNTRGHNSAENAFGVAAVDVGTSFPNPFTGGTKNPVELFSSDGTRRMFFRADGTPFTPGNFSATGGIVRQKPDLAAADGVVTTLPAGSGLNPFFGTSAAAPHAGAIAALVKSFNPSLTPGQIRTILTGSALDIEAPGVDRDSGFGLVMAQEALQATPNPNPPTITSVSPQSGAVGSVVAITGTKFTGATSVKFNGVAAVFTVDSPAQISATVPAGALTGAITITTPTGTATSAAAFTILTSPAITSFNPASGAIGTTVIISGANFTGITGVRFNGVPAGFAIDSLNQITTTVPAGATTGRISVNTASVTNTSTANFTVTALPVIGAFNPALGAAGTPVVITGANLAGTTAVAFNGVPAAFTADSDAQITAVVPAGATTGPITVTQPAGSVASVASFTVVEVPFIAGFTPASGPAGASVAINGNNLTGTTNVTFNGVAAAFIVNAATQITATVPVGATTGLIAVRKPGAAATSAASFEIIDGPDNDAFAAAEVISGDSGTVGGSNIGATKEINEPNHAANPGGKSVWYQWTAPGNGVWQFETVGSTFDTLLAAYTGPTVSSLTQIAANDDLVGATNTVSRLSFAAVAGVAYQIAVDGFRASGAGGGDAAEGMVTLRWSLSASQPAITSFSPDNGPVGTTVVLAGANFTGAVTVAFNGVRAEATVNTPEQITATVPAGATTGPITVTTPAGVAASAANFSVTLIPGNDNFADAQRITGGAGSETGVNIGATKEAGEPDHADNAGGRSVWFTWVAPASQSVYFATAGSSFDTLLAVYTGNDVAALSLIAGSDDAVPDLSSRVVFFANVGTTYRIAVDGYGGAAGTLVLTWNATPDPPAITGFTPPSGGAGSQVVVTGNNFWSATAVRFNGVNAQFVIDSAAQITAIVPATATTGPITVATPHGSNASAASFVVTGSLNNDNFASAQTLSGNVALATGNNAGATKESVEPDHAGNAGGKSLWYRWTAPANGTWTVDLSGSDFDTTLGLYTGNFVSALALVISDDDRGENGASQVTFAATAGVTYRIAVDGFSGADGNVVLRLLPATVPAVLYQTAFEPFEGFNSAFTLAGQDSWIRLGSGGNGLVNRANFGLGQSAFLGFFLPSPVGNTFLWRPINHTPNTAALPVVGFSVVMQIVDSTSGQFDDFEWRVFNVDERGLFSLNFNNNDLRIYRLLDDGAGYTWTGRTFQNSEFLLLNVTMDFARNRWSASLDGQSLVNELPITTTGAALTLGDIDALWLPGAVAGNNFMVFDNYRITAEASAVPAILLPPQTQTVTAGARVVLGVVASGGAPLSYQWRFNGEILAGETNVTLALNSVTAAQAGNYSVRVSNFAGTDVSSDGTLTVNAGNTPPALAAIGNKLVHAGSLLILTNVATDADVPEQQLAFSLARGAPVGASIESSNGILTWTPTMDQIGQTFPISVVATDDGEPAMNAITTFYVNVGQPFSITGVSVSGNLLTLTWPTLAGKSYQVLYQTNLGSDVWLPLGPPRAATGASLSIVENIAPENGPRRFFRIVTSN